MNITDERQEANMGLP
jgi:hypothetical protein